MAEVAALGARRRWARSRPRSSRVGPRAGRGRFRGRQRASRSRSAASACSRGSPTAAGSASSCCEPREVGRGSVLPWRVAWSRASTSGRQSASAVSRSQARSTSSAAATAISRSAPASGSAASVRPSRPSRSGTPGPGGLAGPPCSEVDRVAAGRPSAARRRSASSRSPRQVALALGLVRGDRRGARRLLARPPARSRRGRRPPARVRASSAAPSLPRQLRPARRPGRASSSSASALSSPLAGPASVPARLAAARRRQRRGDSARLLDATVSAERRRRLGRRDLGREVATGRLARRAGPGGSAPRPGRRLRSSPIACCASRIVSKPSRRATSRRRSVSFRLPKKESSFWRVKKVETNARWPSPIRRRAT